MIGAALGVLAAVLLGLGWIGYLVCGGLGLMLQTAIRGWRTRSSAFTRRDQAVYSLLEEVLADHPWKGDRERQAVISQLTKRVSLPDHFSGEVFTHQQAGYLATFVGDLRNRFVVPEFRFIQLLGSLGIPENQWPLFGGNEDRKEALRLLGLPQDADQREISRTFRVLASHFHPDHNEGLDPDQRRKAQEAFLKIRDAVERLKRDGADDPSPRYD